MTQCADFLRSRQHESGFKMKMPQAGHPQPGTSKILTYMYIQQNKIHYALEYFLKSEIINIFRKTTL